MSAELVIDSHKPVLVVSGPVSVGRASSAEPPRPRGRPQLVQSDQVLAAARKLLSERSAATFSIRRLADELSVAPATLYARFGTKNELLAQAYVQRLEELRAEFSALPAPEQQSLGDLLHLLSAPLHDLRLDFALRFEIEGSPAHGVRSTTWRTLRREYLRLVHQVYTMISQAAQQEGWHLQGGSLAERLLWSLLSSGTSDRNAQVYGHKNVSYFRFMAQAITASLGTPAAGVTPPAGARRPPAGG
jgi:AcrR family transcriptional regulator